MTRRVLSPDRVFDSVSGVMLVDVSIVVEHDRVVAVVGDAEIGTIDGELEHFPGSTIIPGLIDCHTHLTGEIDGGQGFASLVTRSGAQDALIGVKHAGEMLRAGFTSVRDIGSFRAFTDVALRDAIDAGWVCGPRMMCAGAYVTTPGGGGDITGLAVDVDDVVPRELRFGVVTGVDQMRSTVRQILRFGADFIKVIATGAVLTSGTNPGAPEFTEAEIRAAVETAAEAGTIVAAHAHGTEGIKRAVRAGVRSIEHGSQLDDECIELMVQHDTFLVADLYDGDWIAGIGPARGYSDEVLRKNDMLNDSHRAGFAKAVEAGVRIAFGTDSGVIPHGINARQFPFYVRHGLEPVEALQSATSWAAELLGWSDRVGSFTPGTCADLVVLPGDPLTDITVLERPAAVMKGGEWVAGVPSG